MSYIPILRRYPGNLTGKEYYMSCPYHDETNASLSVNVNEGQWHCFGCKASGWIGALIADLENISRAEAYELIRKCGRDDLPDRDNGRKKTVPVSEPIDEAVLDRFSPLHGEAFISYVESRGISVDLALKYDLRQGNSSNKRWASRIVYGIRDIEGRLWSVEGRTIADDPIRYCKAKSCRSGAGMFGLPELKGTFGGVFIVEGAFDCLSMVECGYRAVAMCCSDLTESCAAQMRAITNYPVVVLDGVRAGTEADRNRTVRRLRGRLASVFANYVVLTLPDEETDPNDLHRAGALAGVIDEIFLAGKRKGRNFLLH